MSAEFPMEYTLSDGTHVVVTKVGTDRYDFELTPTEGPQRHFTYVEGEKSKAEWDETTDFDEMDALRTFWLKMEEIV